MISEFVGRSKLMRTSPSNSRFWIPCAAARPPAAGAGAGAAAAPPRDRDPPRPPWLIVTCTPVTEPSVCASSSQFAFSQ